MFGDNIYIAHVDKLNILTLFVSLVYKNRKKYVDMQFCNTISCVKCYITGAYSV